MFFTDISVFFLDGLRPRLIHAAIGPVSLIFCPKIPSFFFFFCFPQTQNEPYHPLTSPITLHLVSHSPSLRSDRHHRHPPSPIKNPHSPSLRSQPSPHPPSTISPSPSPFISYLTLNPCLTLHLRSPPSPSTSTTTTTSRPIPGFGLCFEQGYGYFLSAFPFSQFAFGSLCVFVYVTVDFALGLLNIS